VFRLERVDSALDAIHDRAAAGAPAGTVVVAGEQLAGRGARGDPWHSPPGGLWLSILLRPAVPVGVGVLSLRTGLAVATALDRVTGGESVGLKWPNDLILRDRKLGGILCEARWQGCCPAPSRDLWATSR
jgi:BirA family biotin operon repressor/biotin-[acetyl-CoA-carboxylase] ligase